MNKAGKSAHIVFILCLKRKELWEGRVIPSVYPSDCTQLLDEFLPNFIIKAVINFIINFVHNLA
jgi:hypothetical protein